MLARGHGHGRALHADAAEGVAGLLLDGVMVGRLRTQLRGLFSMKGLRLGSFQLLIARPD